MFTKLDFQYTPPKNTDRIPITDHSAECIKLKTTPDKIIVNDQSSTTAKMHFIEETPYISDMNAFKYSVKDGQLDIADSIENNFSLINSITLYLSSCISKMFWISIFTPFLSVMISLSLTLC